MNQLRMMNKIKNMNKNKKLVMKFSAIQQSSWRGRCEREREKERENHSISCCVIHSLACNVCVAAGFDLCMMLNAHDNRTAH